MADAEPRVLILETSGRTGLVAVAEGPRLGAVRRLDEARRHARDLVPAVRDLLAERGWTARDLNAVLVSKGPGSYTGLRVGLMSAKALAYATGCALVAVETFVAVAQQVPAEVLRVDVLGDAQQDKVYLQEFGRAAGDDVLRPRSELRIEPFPDWLARRAPDAWATGPGLRRHEDRLGGMVNLVAADHWDPRPESLLRLGLPRYRAGERDDFWALEPLYLRPSSAEEQWQARQK